MDRAALLADFESKVATYAQHHAYIERARARASEFSAEAIDIVVSDHTGRAMALLEQIIVSMTEVDRVVTDLDGQREAIAAESGAVVEKVQEMELRLLIGEMTQETFDAEAKDPKERIAAFEQRIEDVDAELVGFRGALDRWTEIGVKAGVIAPTETDLDEASLDIEELPFDDVDEPSEGDRPIIEELELLPDG